MLNHKSLDPLRESSPTTGRALHFVAVAPPAGRSNGHNANWTPRTSLSTLDLLISNELVGSDLRREGLPGPASAPRADNISVLRIVHIEEERRADGRWQIAIAAPDA